MNIEQGINTAVLWDRCRTNWNRAIQTQKDWEVHVYDAGQDLLKLREQYVGDTEFGQECRRRGVNIGHQNQAALLAMSREPKKFKRVLAKTTRRSIQHIYAKEWDVEPTQPSAGKAAGSNVEPSKSGRFTHVSKATQPEPAPAKPTKPAKARKSEARVDYDKRLSEAKAELKDKSEAEIDRKVDAKFEKLKAKLEREYQHRTEELKKREKRVMLRLDSVDGLVPKEDDTLIIKCLHPDHVTALGPEVVAMHEKGWRAYHKWRDFIVVKLPEKW